MAPPPPEQILRIDRHDRDSAGLTYIYPVISRRAGGVSVGINLNPNNACNWHCIYCQVPNLQRGVAPPIDLALLEAELRFMLDQMINGDFMVRRVPATMRRLNDIAFSGNGEPTTSKQFPECVERVGQILEDYALLGKIKLILITNGSQFDHDWVQQGVKTLSRFNGQVWFKLDRAPGNCFSQVNQIYLGAKQVARHLHICASLCETWLQICMFSTYGLAPGDKEIQDWLDFVQARLDEKVSLAGVFLYGLARPSMQVDSQILGPLSAEWMVYFKKKIEDLGLHVEMRS